MKRLTLCSSFAAGLLISGCATHQPLQPASLRVMSFNIRLNLASDGPNAWPHRSDEVASMIRLHGADLVGLQEARPDQLRDLESLLPEYGRFGVGRDADLGGEHSAILYRSSRIEVLAHDTFWLSETPETPGSKGWDAAYERIVTWGRLRDRRSGDVFFHFNTHFDHVGLEARRESARMVTESIERIASDFPVVLTGDFNDTPGSEPLSVITTAGLADALDASRCPHHGPTSSWNGFVEIEPQRRIDFILVSGRVAVLQHAILSDTFDGRFPSDHLPVIADLMIGAEAEGPCRAVE